MAQTTDMTRDSLARKLDPEPASSPWGWIGLGALALGLAGVAAGGGSKKPSKPANDKPADPKPPADKPSETSLLDRYPGLSMIDFRSRAPKDQILRFRGLDEVTAVVLHQTSFAGWKDDNPLWPKIKAHFVVRRDGRVQINYDPEVRMTTGSNAANKFCVSIEHEGNYPNSNGNCYQPDKFGCYSLADAPNQVASSRKLIADLVELCPKLTAVFAHTQWAADRQNCPGPGLWLAIGEWAIQNLNLKDGGPGWKYGDGHAIPNSWRGEMV